MDYIYQFISLIKRLSGYFGLTSGQNFEHAFYQLLHQRRYDEAMKLALQNNYLDIDLVHKCRWRNSGITVQSINSVLGKIEDKLWAINECVRTVPISHEACRTLIEFGLREANLRLLYQLGNEAEQTKGGKKLNSGDRTIDKLIGRKQEKQPLLLAEDISDDEIEGLIDFENLNDQQKELCKCRQDLLRHEHSLFSYESILGDYRAIQQHFDHVFYDEFRNKCPLNACIDFAHEGDGHAVEMLLNFYTDDLAHHLLSILSNFPETLSPYQYRNLLPCLRDNNSSDEIFQWRPISGKIRRTEDNDWSSRGCENEQANSSSFMVCSSDIAQDYESEFYSGESEYLKKYLKPLTGDLLTEWFQERALEMESKTLLLSNAIQLLHLGTELNIKNLKELHDNLIEFDKIVFDCCAESNIYLSYSEFIKMSEIECLILMTGDSVKNCKDRFRFYVIPYIHRRENKLGKDGKADLLRKYFLRLAATREKICHSIYQDLLDKIECDNFVAEWTQGLDDTIDQIGDEIIRVERERQAKELTNMANQTLALRDYNGCYEACQLIMRNSFNDCWAICCQLGMNKDFRNFEAKYQLLAFALAHCEDQDHKISVKILDYIIELRKRDERLQLAYLESNS